MASPTTPRPYKQLSLAQSFSRAKASSPSASPSSSASASPLAPASAPASRGVAPSSSSPSTGAPSTEQPAREGPSSSAAPSSKGPSSSTERPTTEAPSAVVGPALASGRAALAPTAPSTTAVEDRDETAERATSSSRLLAALAQDASPAHALPAIEHAEDVFDDTQWDAVEPPPVPPAPRRPLPNARSAHVEALLNRAARSEGASEGWLLPVTTISLVPRGDPSTALLADAWDANHVRMPCSSQNVLVLPDGRRVRKWDAIIRVLRRPISNLDVLVATITSYNAGYAKDWSFGALADFFHDECTPSEAAAIFANTIPAMATMALRLPELFPRPIPLLRSGQGQALTLNQEQGHIVTPGDQIASLLANAFFCTFPRRNAVSAQSEYATFPGINFSRLFQLARGRRGDRMVQKLRCLFHYFERLRKKADLSAKVTYARHVLAAAPEWPHLSSTKLAPLTVRVDGLIEDDGLYMRQMDFANEFIGGGALGTGLVQEEIRFMICPELIASMLFTEVLGPNEAMVITGVERFAHERGQSRLEGSLRRGRSITGSPTIPATPIRLRGTRTTSTLCPSRRCTDSPKLDHSDATTGHRRTEVAAFDAICFQSLEANFEPHAIERELVKAAVGFWADPADPSPPPVATGLWGCGAFRGDPELKTLVQWMAAAVARRGMLFFTFNNAALSRDIADLHQALTSRGTTVADLYHLTLRYSELRGVRPRGSALEAPSLSLFQFIRNELGLPAPARNEPPAAGPLDDDEDSMNWEAADAEAAAVDAALAQRDAWPMSDSAEPMQGDDAKTQLDPAEDPVAASAAGDLTQIDVAPNDATQVDEPPRLDVDPPDDLTQVDGDRM